MLISDLRRLEARAAVETPKLAAVEEETAAKLQKAEAATRAAQLMHIKALAARQSFAFDFGREHDRIETELRATASPLIAAFVAEMNAAWDKTRREPLTQETATSDTKSAATGRPETYLKTNAAAVARRLRSIRATILAAEELAISEPDQSTIPAQLGELAAKLPPMI
jgi:hypothetical protein